MCWYAQFDERKIKEMYLNNSRRSRLQERQERRTKMSPKKRTHTPHVMTDPGGRAWAEKLAQALAPWTNEWCEAHNLTRKQLADKLGISIGKLGHILMGDTITSDIRVYAKLYVLTGLDEANPLFIPSNYRGPRSWTREEYTAWTKSEDAQRLAALMQDSLPTDVPLAKDEHIHDLLVEVTKLLEGQFYVNKKQREDFLKTYGFDLGKLEKFLVTLMLPPNDRELSIAMTVDSEE